MLIFPKRFIYPKYINTYKEEIIKNGLKHKTYYGKFLKDTVKFIFYTNKKPNEIITLLIIFNIKTLKTYIDNKSSESILFER